MKSVQVYEGDGVLPLSAIGHDNIWYIYAGNAQLLDIAEHDVVRLTGRLSSITEENLLQVRREVNATLNNNKIRLSVYATSDNAEPVVIANQLLERVVILRTGGGYELWFKRND